MIGINLEKALSSDQKMRSQFRPDTIIVFNSGQTQGGKVGTEFKVDKENNNTQIVLQSNT